MARLGSKIFKLDTPHRDKSKDSSRYLTFFLSSEDCMKNRPGNKPSDFTVDLPAPLYLEGMWSMAIVDIAYGTSGSSSSQGGDIYVMCNICKESLAGGRYMKVLRRLWAKPQARKVERFKHPCYVPLDTGEPLIAIRLYIMKTTLMPISLGDTAVTCTLQLCRS